MCRPARYGSNCTIHPFGPDTVTVAFDSTAGLGLIERITGDRREGHTALPRMASLLFFLSREKQPEPDVAVVICQSAC